MKKSTHFFFSFLKVLNKQVDPNVCKTQLIDTPVVYTVPLLFVADNITNTQVELHLKTLHITFFFSFHQDIVSGIFLISKWSSLAIYFHFSANISSAVEQDTAEVKGQYNALSVHCSTLSH